MPRTAERNHERLEALRAERERRRGMGQPHLLRAYVELSLEHLRQGQGDEAESAVRAAVQQARAWADPAELGACLVQLARTQAHLKRSDRALLAYTEGLAHLALAGHDVRDVRAELEALGRVEGGAR